MIQTGIELVERSLELKKKIWEQEQLQRFTNSGKDPKNDSWKDKYKGVTQIEGETHELPNDWAWASAEAICSSVRDGTHDTPKYVEKGIPLITSKNLINGKIDYKKIKMISENDHEEISKRSHVHNGDILFAMIGTIGNPVVVKKTSNFSIKNVGLFKIDDKFIKSTYLKYWLDSPEFNNWLKPRLKGTTQKFAPLGLLRALPVPVAPPEQQKRIVAKIEELFSHIDAGIEALKKAKQLLKQYRQSVLKAAVTGELTKEWREDNKTKLEPTAKLLECILKERRQKWEEQQLEQFKTKGKIPKDDKWKEKYKEPTLTTNKFFSGIPSEWEEASIDQLAREVRYGTSSKTNDDETGVPVIRMGNIVEGDLDYSKLKYLPAYHDEFPELLLDKGDILFNRTNSAELVGKTAVFRNTGKQTSFASYLIRVKALSGVEPNFVAYFINSSCGRNWIKSCVSQNVGQANVNGTKLKALVLPLPCHNEQKEIVKRVEEKMCSSDRLIAELDFQLLKAEMSKQSILASAFNGNI